MVRGGWDKLGGQDWHTTLLCVKWLPGTWYKAKEAQLGALWRVRWVGWGVWVEGPRVSGHKHTYSWFTVGQQKLTQHCNAMMCVCMLSRVWHFAAPWTVARQAPLSMGFPRQEYWSFHFLHGLNPRLLCLLHRQEDSLPLSHLGSPKQLYSNLKKRKGEKKVSGSV